MKKIISNGTEVLIFEASLYADDTEYIKGTIVSSKLSDDLSMHGSPWYEQIYTVLGEDGNEYVGPCDDGLGWRNYIRTKENYIDFLNKKILNNNKEISIIEKKNEMIKEEIETLKIEKSQKTLSKKMTYSGKKD